MFYGLLHDAEQFSEIPFSAVVISSSSFGMNVVILVRPHDIRKERGDNSTNHT